MRVRHLSLVLAVLLVLGLTACSKATTGPASSTTSTPSATATSPADASAMSKSNPDPATLLTIADVEKVTGLTGIKLLAKGSTTDALGRLNFGSSDGTLLATMNIGDGTAFDQSLQSMVFSHESTGTGSMSFVGPSPKVSKVLTIFAAAKGDHSVIMKTFTKTKGGTETWLTIPQLQALVGLALGRWGA